MKALVLHQPWASLAAVGAKTIETRPMPPNGSMRPEGVRGLPGLAVEPGERIAIVAGKQEVSRTLREVGDWQISTDRAPGAAVMWPNNHPVGTPLPLGAVVCTAVVPDVLPMVDKPGNPHGTGPALLLEDDLLTYWCGDLSDEEMGRFDGQMPYGYFAPGRWGWLLTSVEPCEPVPVVGRQGVFEMGFQP